MLSVPDEGAGGGVVVIDGFGAVDGFSTAGSWASASSDCAKEAAHIVNNAQTVSNSVPTWRNGTAFVAPDKEESAARSSTRRAKKQAPL